MCALLSCSIHAWLFVTAWIVAHQLPLSMGFSRQEHWGGPLCLPPGDIPSPGMQPASLCFLIGRQVLYHYLPRAESKRQESHLKKNIYFNWRLIILQYCGVFLPYINMNRPQVHMCPPAPSWVPVSSPSPLYTFGLSLWVPCFMHWTCPGHLFYMW